jgi:hypothetical protein
MITAKQIDRPSKRESVTKHTIAERNKVNPQTNTHKYIEFPGSKTLKQFSDSS